MYVREVVLRGWPEAAAGTAVCPPLAVTTHAPRPPAAVQGRAREAQAQGRAAAKADGGPEEEEEEGRKAGARVRKCGGCMMKSGSL